MRLTDCTAIRRPVQVERNATIDPEAWRKLVAILRDLIAAPTPGEPRKVIDGGKR